MDKLITQFNKQHDLFIKLLDSITVYTVFWDKKFSYNYSATFNTYFLTNKVYTRNKILQDLEHIYTNIPLLFNDDDDDNDDDNIDIIVQFRFYINQVNNYIDLLDRLCKDISYNKQIIDEYNKQKLTDMIQSNLCETAQI